MDLRRRCRSRGTTTPRPGHPDTRTRRETHRPDGPSRCAAMTRCGNRDRLLRAATPNLPSVGETGQPTVRVQQDVGSAEISVGDDEVPLLRGCPGHGPCFRRTRAVPQPVGDPPTPRARCNGVGQGVVEGAHRLAKNGGGTAGLAAPPQIAGRQTRELAGEHPGVCVGQACLDHLRNGEAVSQPAEAVGLHRDVVGARDRGRRDLEVARRSSIAEPEGASSEQIRGDQFSGRAEAERGDQLDRRIVAGRHRRTVSGMNPGATGL